MKLTLLVILAIVLFCTVFGVNNAGLNKEILILVAMMLLLTLFPDLKEFDFWGLRGKKDERIKELEELEGMDGINEEETPTPDEEAIQNAEKETEINLMDSTRGNFLALAFEIERLLKIASTIILKDERKTLADAAALKGRGFLTENGFKQVEAIRWLRNMLVHGRGDEINESDLKTGTNVAFNLYNELNNWFNSPAEEKQD